MSSYNIGTYKKDITLKDVKGIGLQGFSIPEQKTDGTVLEPLFARAFAIFDTINNRHLVIVIADLWSCTEKIKTQVIKRLINKGNLPYSEKNVMISGTHTHSGPGGYSDYRMYNVNNSQESQKVNIQLNFETIVNGIVDAIYKAHEKLKPGKIFYYAGQNNIIQNCGLNRSFEAYLQNPEEERRFYNKETDNDIKVIKFVIDEGNKEIGVLSWYPLHCTDIGQHNFFISGDNKGHAAKLFEEQMMGTNSEFVAAFANSNCGDVSGNVVYENGKKVLRPPLGGQKDIENMQRHGKQQFDKVYSLFVDPIDWVELTGSIDFRHVKVDMSNVGIPDTNGQVTKKTYLPTTGLATYAGSKEDGRTPFLPFNLLDEMKGLRDDKLTITERPVLVTIQALTSGTGPIDPMLALLSDIIAQRTLKSIPVSEMPYEDKKGHFPKPIAVFANGIVPSNLPLQLFKIGNLVIPGIPAELTTMAGRRLTKTILKAFEGTEVKFLTLGTYSNAYAQYITTKEEYDHQNYEGASTLFGPYTLEAYQYKFQQLADDMKNSIPAMVVPLIA